MEVEVIGLLQVDGKWPNLALMHIGGYYKEAVRISPIEQGICEVVYASKVFTGSDGGYIREDAIRGGTGWADWERLPELGEEIEHSYPAYEKFRCKEAMGFLTRGCIRNCEFCFVPRKEGKIRHHSHLSEWWRGQERIILLDANLTAHPECLGYLEELEKSKAEVDFSQGVDVRLMTDEVATAIARVRRYKQLHIAWDKMKDEGGVLRGIRVLMAHMPKGSVMAYVLIGYDTTEEEDYYRVKKLSEVGIDPFVMAYNRGEVYQRRFARWVNHKAIYKSVVWEEYK